MILASLDRRAALRAALSEVRPRGAAKAYRIMNANAAEAEVRIYDAIASYAVNAEDFAAELAQITAPTINLHINSPGGSVFDGLAIYNTLKAHPAKVVTYVDGIAASIASIIALAGDEVKMRPGAFVMIHNPWSLVIGDAGDMREQADLLDKVAGSLAGIYAARTGQSTDDVLALMDAETWWTAQEAADAGYATLIEDPAADGAATTQAAARFDLSLFAKVPAELRAAAANATAETPTTKREFEAFLRDVGGFSHAAAKSIAAAGFKPKAEPRDEDEAGAEKEALQQAQLAEELERMQELTDRLRSLTTRK